MKNKMSFSFTSPKCSFITSFSNFVFDYHFYNIEKNYAWSFYLGIWTPYFSKKICISTLPLLYKYAQVINITLCSFVGLAEVWNFEYSFCLNEDFKQNDYPEKCFLFSYFWNLNNVNCPIYLYADFFQ